MSAEITRFPAAPTPSVPAIGERVRIAGVAGVVDGRMLRLNGQHFISVRMVEGRFAGGRRIAPLGRIEREAVP